MASRDAYLYWRDYLRSIDCMYHLVNLDQLECDMIALGYKKAIIGDVKRMVSDWSRGDPVDLALRNARAHGIDDSYEYEYEAE